MAAGSAMTETQAFRATAADISGMDGWVEQIGTRWGIPERTLFRARICIAEVAANLFEHGGSFQPSIYKIVITLHNRAPAIEIEFVDAGMGFNPIEARSHAPADVGDGVPDTGRGLLLLHSYALKIDYRRDLDRNVLRFRVSAD